MTMRVRVRSEGPPSPTPSKGAGTGVGLSPPSAAQHAFRKLKAFDSLSLIPLACSLRSTASRLCCACNHHFSRLCQGFLEGPDSGSEQEMKHPPPPRPVASAGPGMPRYWELDMQCLPCWWTKDQHVAVGTHPSVFLLHSCSSCPDRCSPRSLESQPAP